FQGVAEQLGADRSMMMKNQQQQSMNGVHGGQTPSETKWWYKGPDGETYGPYTAREMRMWGSSGYFNDALPVKTDKDEQFHSIGDWTAVMGGANPFLNPSVPAFNVLMHGAHAQFLLYPPGLPTPSPFPGGSPSNGGRFGGPPFPAPSAAMANLHLGGAGGGHMGIHPIHLGGPLSQPPSEPNDGANSSNSHSPDNAEPDFRSLHQMGGMAPSLPSMHTGRMHFGYGMPPMQPSQPMAAATYSSNGQLQYNRITSTQDAPWNTRREVAVDASLRSAPRHSVATQTLPVIIGSKDASRLLSDLTGCSIVIT
ncbi:hypothetical protein PMAYCL1PPCAC_29873, partial [Pristionchus mayeri]